VATKIKQLAELAPLKGWTVETYAAHNEAMRAEDARFHTERDRRYTEGAALNAIALKIKETADLAALTLAREGLTMDQARLDSLRDKSLGDSGIYAKNSDLTLAINALKQSQEHAIGELVNKLQPFIDLVTQQQGNSRGSDMVWGKIAGTITVLIAIFIALRTGTHPVIP
jgi:hypothetical protein